jgi:hypothetical protein
MVSPSFLVDQTDKLLNDAFANWPNLGVKLVMACGAAKLWSFGLALFQR